MPSRRCVTMTCGICHMTIYYRYPALVLLVLSSTVLVVYFQSTKSLASHREIREYSLTQYTFEVNTQQFYTSSSSVLGNTLLRSGEERFLQINTNEAWVYSAFFDTINDKNLIRVFGIQPRNLQTPVFCYLKTNDQFTVIEGTRSLLVDGNGKRLRVVSYECWLTDGRRPDQVSITLKKTDSPTNTLQVLYPSLPRRNFTVCYAMLFDLTNYSQIIQNVEFNRVLGAEHFFVYNMSISSATDAVLRHYQKRGLMTILQWPMNISGIHYFGQVLAINDCVYRNKGVSKYVVIHDTDEMIVPNRQNSWKELIDQINDNFDQINDNSTSHETLGTYIFETTCFQDRPKGSLWSEIKRNYSISDEMENFFEKYSLTAFTDLLRLNTVWAGTRQKSIVRPDLVLFPDIHLTTTHRGSATQVVVNHSLALVHHQRKWSVSPSDILEVTALRFKDKVIPLVNETYLKLIKGHIIQ
ncbi:beta-1,4-galactosyltransferase galt-1-like [Biomphalaria glabrata]|uniref:Glycosyltransferase family 92 protein n=1 Tax=Biomphalaria glabrata TaxID=6526 RepID=A0A9W3BE52_BIOGL|nr:beta-1,4-galactosyltransferase galt-1-like [Biomphalaria glabrata]XP_055897872.1 beta-1,4-galactosyltransferase galt-1-like [Biomphalaria glabrata]XP_055897873.1 beta-1,4-galactosyltransferase galt-1-like [Biomphalaria glabrata]